MDIKLNEFMAISRASAILKSLKEKDCIYKDLLGSDKPVVELTELIKTTPNAMSTSIYPEEDVISLTQKFEFLMEVLIPGVQINKFVLVNKDKTMSHIILMKFIHKRMDNLELVQTVIPIKLMTDEIVAVTPFNSPELNALTRMEDQYVAPLFNTLEIQELDYNNKSEIIGYLTEEREAYVMSVIDAIATSIHMQIEYVEKNFGALNNFGYRVVTKEEEEFNSTYGDYMKSDTIDSHINPIDYTPIMVSDENGVGFLKRVTKKRGNHVITEYAVGESVPDGSMTSAGLEELVVYCPEKSAPVGIKLPNETYYWKYNTITMLDGDREVTDDLLTPHSPVIDEEYVPFSGMIGMEGEKLDKFKGMVNAKLLIPFKKFGITKGTKLYEILLPLTKLPIDVAKSALSMSFNIFRTNNQIEKKETLELQEKLLNDELDSSTIKFKNMIGKYAVLVGAATIMGGWFFGIIVWLISRNRFAKIQLKSFERVEHRVVSYIQTEEQKLSFAKQESDYEAVKKIQLQIDAYKLMLNKLREAKKEVLGKKERYEDKSSEYNA